jgi:hypothetical protein
MSETPDDRVIRSYLFGEMTADERAAFQEQLFADEDLFARVCEIETDLVDALARGELPAADAGRVREFLRETSQQAPLTFATALARMETRPTRSRVQPWVLALAACLLVGIAALLLNIRNQPADTRTAQVQPPPSAAGEIYAINIAPGVLRGEEQRVLVRPPAAARIVELRLGVRAPGNHPHYQVQVTDVSGKPVLSEIVPGPLQAELRVPVARAALVPGNYEITLSGIDANGNSQAIEYYYFRVE